MAHLQSNHNTDFQTQKIIDIIQSANTIDDVSKLLPYYDIEDIKTLLIKQTKDKPTTSIKQMYFNIASMHDIIPPDIIRYITSFSTLQELVVIKLVSKQWNKWCNHTEKKKFTKLHETLDKDGFLKFNKKTNNVWITTNLTIMMKELKYKSLSLNDDESDLFKIINSDRIKDGDRIYVIKHTLWQQGSVKINKDISIIGLDNAGYNLCQTFAERDNPILTINKGKKLFIQGFKFNIVGACGITSELSSHLILNCCHLRSYAVDCILKLSVNSSNAIITNCEFTGNKCIALTSEGYTKPTNYLDLLIKGNSFTTKVKSATITMSKTYNIYNKSIWNIEHNHWNKILHSSENNDHFTLDYRKAFKVVFNSTVNMKRHSIVIGYETKSFKIGRDARKCNIVLDRDSPMISREHCEFTLIVNKSKVIKLFCKDLNSRNGVFINDTRIPSNTLYLVHNKDVIRFGIHIQKQCIAYNYEYRIEIIPNDLITEISTI